MYEFSFDGPMCLYDALVFLQDRAYESDVSRISLRLGGGVVRLRCGGWYYDVL